MIGTTVYRDGAEPTVPRLTDASNDGNVAMVDQPVQVVCI